jgi:hypothetical protein
MGGASLSSTTFLLLCPSWLRTRVGAPYLGARDGTPAPPGQSARRADWHACFRGLHPWGGLLPFWPLRCATQWHGVRGGAERHLARGQTGGILGNSCHSSWRRASKAGGGRNPSRPSHQIHWGFLSPFLYLRPWDVKKREKDRGKVLTWRCASPSPVYRGGGARSWSCGSYSWELGRRDAPRRREVVRWSRGWELLH